VTIFCGYSAGISSPLLQLMWINASEVPENTDYVTLLQPFFENPLSVKATA
jgi:hypothetical protein